MSSVIAVLVKVGWIRGFDSYSAGNVARSLQDALVCFEMLAVAGACFPHDVWLACLSS
jgi:hypothetical protein